MPTPRIDDTQIAQAAYFLWLDEGQPEGRADAHWTQAVKTLTSTAPKARKPRAKTAAPKKAAAPKTPSETGKPKVAKPRTAKKTA